MGGNGASDCVRRWRRILWRSLWLPIGIVILGVIRFGPEPSLLSLPALSGLVVAWPGGIPLTVALERLRARSRRLAIGCAIVLYPLSVVAATAGGLLGPIGIWVCAAVVALPAWVVLGILTVCVPADRCLRPAGSVRPG